MSRIALFFIGFLVSFSALAADVKKEVSPVFTESNFNAIQANLKNFTPEQIAAIAVVAQKTQPELKNVSLKHIEYMLNDMATMQSSEEIGKLGRTTRN